MKNLYHYTSIERWQRIVQSGRLRTTDSNLSKTREHAGPDVVWLTTDADCRYGHGLRPTRDGTDKERVRITVRVANRYVHKWSDWAVHRGIDPQWRRTLIRTAGDDGGASTWRVVEKPIPAAWWLEVIDRSDGTVLWRPLAGDREIVDDDVVWTA